jgi:hypothetical protein
MVQRSSFPAVVADSSYSAIESPSTGVCDHDVQRAPFAVVRGGRTMYAPPPVGTLQTTELPNVERLSIEESVIA